MPTRLESEFQAELIKELKLIFPGCLILKNDANYKTGIPDLLILFNSQWALLEVKRSANERPRPNQPYYVSWGQRHSFGAFIYPENKAAVLEELFDFFN